MPPTAARQPLQFGAFRPEDREEVVEKSQVAENTKKKPRRITLTESIKNEYSTPVAKISNKRVPAKVAFIPSEEEKRAIQAVQAKLGINKATDVLRMGLKRLADGIKVAG